MRHPARLTKSTSQDIQEPNVFGLELDNGARYEVPVEGDLPAAANDRAPEFTCVSGCPKGEEYVLEMRFVQRKGTPYLATVGAPEGGTTATRERGVTAWYHITTWTPGAKPSDRGVPAKTGDN